MNWTNVGKSFSAAASNSLISLDEKTTYVASGNSDAIDNDFDASSDEEPSSKYRRISASEHDNQPYRKRILDVTWAIDRRRGQDIYNYKSITVSASSSEVYESYNEERGSSPSIRHRSKKQRVGKHGDMADLNLYNQNDSNTELNDFARRYFGKYNKREMVSLHQKRLKFIAKHDEEEESQNFIISPQIKHYQTFIDNKVGSIELRSLCIKEDIVTSLNDELLSLLRRWKTDFSEITRFSSIVGIQNILDSIRLVIASNLMISSLSHLSSGEFDSIPGTEVMKASKLIPFRLDRFAAERIVSMLNELITGVKTILPETYSNRDSILGKIALQILYTGQYFLAFNDLNQQLNGFLNDIPLAWDLHKFQKSCLRSNYPTSAFQNIRDFESSFWNSLQLGVKNRAAARSLLARLVSNSTDNEDYEEKLLKSIEIQRKRLEDVAYYDRLLIGMGFQEHSVAHFQALIMIHIKEMDTPDAAFAVREILKQWEGESDPRIGESLYYQNVPTASSIISLIVSEYEEFKISDQLDMVFPSSSKIVEEATFIGPALPPRNDQTISTGLAASDKNISSQMSSSQTKINESEIVDGKVLVYSRVHGYKIWIPVDAAAEDTSLIYRQILASAEDPLVNEAIDKFGEVQENSSTIPRKEKRDCSIIGGIKRIHYVRSSAEHYTKHENNFLDFVWKDYHISALQNQPLRALGLYPPGNENLAIQEMEAAERFPERIVFSEDIKPFVFWIRNSVDHRPPSLLTEGIYSIPSILVNLGPSALGIHFTRSLQYISIEEELLSLETSVLQPTMPTFAVVHQLLKFSKALPQSKEEVLKGLLDLIDSTDRNMSPIFISHQLHVSHTMYLIKQQYNEQEVVGEDSRLLFAIRLIEQLIERFESFQQSPRVQSSCGAVEGRWLYTVLSQLRQCAMHLYFARYKIELQYLTSKSSSDSIISNYVEQFRERCRRFLEFSTTSFLHCPVHCIAGDLGLWSQYLKIEKELLERQHNSSLGQSISYSALWKMADKVLRIVDAQRNSAPDQELGVLYHNELQLYCTIVSLLFSIALQATLDQRPFYIKIIQDFLVQRGISMWNKSASATVTASSVLKALMQLDGGKSKKKSKQDDFQSNPMMDQEALLLWQQFCKRNTDDLICTEPNRETLDDIPDLSHAVFCTDILETLLLTGRTVDEDIYTFSTSTSSIAILKERLNLISQRQLSQNSDLEKNFVNSLLADILVRRLESTAYLELCSTKASRLYSVQESSLAVRPSVLDQLCAFAIDGLLTVPTADSLLLGCFVHLHYFGVGYGLNESTHDGYRTIRQYWKQAHLKRTFKQASSSTTHTHVQQMMMEYAHIVGCSGDALSVRERCFEIAVELIRHNHILYQYVYSSCMTAFPVENTDMKFVWPDWKLFFTDMVPHYKVMYGYHSHDEDISQVHKCHIRLPALAESLHRISAVFEQILSCPTMKNVPWFWRLYSHSLLSVGDVIRARKITLRALSNCGWCKAIFLDLLGPLTAQQIGGEVEVESDAAVILRMMEAQGMFLRS